MATERLRDQHDMQPCTGTEDSARFAQNKAKLGSEQRQ